MSRLSRKVTCEILDMMDQGVLDPRTVADMCLNAMSEDDVAEMARLNELLVEDEDQDIEDEVDESMDGDHESALASAGFGTDEDYAAYGFEIED